MGRHPRQDWRRNMGPEMTLRSLAKSYAARWQEEIARIEGEVAKLRAEIAKKEKELTGKKDAPAAARRVPCLRNGRR
jgi:hypothetical protein